MAFRTVFTLGDRDGDSGPWPGPVHVDVRDRLWAARGRTVGVFDPEGRPEVSWTLPDGTGPGPITGLATAGELVFVARPRGVDVVDRSGRRRGGWSDLERLVRVTALAVSGDDLFLADAGVRRVQRYDREGRFLNQIGDRHRLGGFHIPNGFLEVAVDAEGRVLVPNPGLHRVERYRPDGEMVDRFGHFDGVDPAGFPGCCNPMKLAPGPDGRIAVSEKAGPRVKLLDGDGRLLEVVAAGEPFDPAVRDLDVAIDSRGRIAVADPVRGRVTVFAPDEVEEGA